MLSGISLVPLSYKLSDNQRLRSHFFPLMTGADKNNSAESLRLNHATNRWIYNKNLARIFMSQFHLQALRHFMILKIKTNQNLSSFLTLTLVENIKIDIVSISYNIMA